jgi:hypothetical protein
MQIVAALSACAALPALGSIRAPCTLASVPAPGTASEVTMNIDDEKAALEKADIDIASARERITHQQALILELERDGHETSEASKLLSVLCETLRVMIEYRATIVDQINRLSKR